MQCFLNENDCLTLGSIMIRVVKVYHDSVKLGITDPSATPIYREEMLYIRNEEDDNAEVFDPIAIEHLSPFATSAY